MQCSPVLRLDGLVMNEFSFMGHLCKQINPNSQNKQYNTSAELHCSDIYSLIYSVTSAILHTCVQ